MSPFYNRTLGVLFFERLINKVFNAYLRTKRGEQRIQNAVPYLFINHRTHTNDQYWYWPAFQIQA